MNCSYKTLHAESMTFRIPRLYAIIDAAQSGSRSSAALAEVLVASGVRLIQYRDKAGSSRQIFDASCEIARRVQQSTGIFIVNDRADIARAVGANGVHLGQDDLRIEQARQALAPGQWAGLSTHNLAQVVEADAAPADYIAFGPIFSTRSKERPDPVVGLEGLREARKKTSKPLVAIGGITLANARSVIEAGADSVAVIQDLLGAEDVAARARKVLQILAE